MLARILGRSEAAKVVCVHVCSGDVWDVCGPVCLCVWHTYVHILEEARHWPLTSLLPQSKPSSAESPLSLDLEETGSEEHLATQHAFTLSNAVRPRALLILGWAHPGSASSQRC